MKIFPIMFMLVSAVAKAADTNALPALAPAYGELPPTFWEQHETAIIVGIFAFLAFAFLLLRVMLRPESEVVLPPEVLARQSLAKLQSQPEDGKLLSQVSQILRRYVVTAFEFPAGEMTTAEFCGAIVANEKIGAEIANSVSVFLRECDERKFSSSPSVMPLNAVIRALEFVSHAEKRRAELRAQIPAAQ